MSSSSRAQFWNFFEALYSRELTDASPVEETPSWIKTPLLPHQQSAVAAALALEKGKFDGIDVATIKGDTHGGRLYASYGILGDRVGSGKSLTALSLIRATPPPTEYTEYVTRGSRFGDERDVGLLRTKSQLQSAVREGEMLRAVTTTLFLIPHALVGQWEVYVERDTSLKALFIKRKLEAANPKLAEDFEKYDVIFVSSTMWATFRDTQPVRSVLWRRIFVDEADSIAITSDSASLHACFYWFITASWLNLVFSSGAYFNIHTYITPFPETPPAVIRRVEQLQAGNAALTIPGCRHVNLARQMCGIASGTNYLYLSAAAFQSANLIVRSAEEYISRSFMPTEITHNTIVCATPQNIRVLDTFISDDVMERLHAGDVSGALEMIGMSAHTEAEITDAVTANLKKDLENAKRVHEFKKGIVYSSDALKQKALEACEQKIASIESRISAIQDRMKTVKDQTCPICYSEVTSPAVTPCCQQLFCFPCICESLKRVAACPLCRTRIDDLKAIRVVGAAGGGAPAAPVPVHEKLTKRAAFLNYVKEHRTARILMFSGYDATFIGVEQTMRDEGLTFATLHGSQARITKLLREFKEGKYNVLFLNARNMGAGLNIDTATHVILFHKMSAELEKQIIGRAVRLGRKTPLNVVHLLHDNEIGNVMMH